MIIDLSRRSTDDLVAFDAARDSPDSLVYVSPKTSVTAGTTIPIAAGANYFHQLTGARVPLGKEVSVASGDFVVIESLQRIKVPRNMFGLIHGKGRALFRGVMVAPGKIDPSFSGHLRIYIFNAGRAEVAIAAGEVIASIVFQIVEATYQGMEVGEGFPAIPPRPGFFKRVLLKIRRLPKWVWAAAGAFVTGAVFVIKRLY